MPNVTCEICGKIYWQYPYYVGKYDHNFCSRACMHEWQKRKALELNQIEIDEENQVAKISIKNEITFIIDLEDLPKIKNRVVINRPSDQQDYDLILTRPKESLARFLLNAAKNEVISYLDGNPLNCRKSNLKLISKSERNETRKVGRNSHTRVKGVYYDPTHGGRKQYRAHITKNRITFHIGWYETLEEAKEAREEAEKILHKYGTYIKEYRSKLNSE